MAIPVGTKFGPYEILGLIGAGGMGEVHRARDTRLGREVAIKTLPPGLSREPERLRRFETEARAASLLSHPNILTVYDIGTADGQPYIVSELLEGENLRERLNRGPLSPRKSVEIAVPIADGLAAAHARGIVHRDLKPENLFLTRDGHVKILDFGIAKLTVSESEHPAGAPTVTILTDVGVAVGTLGYMAPEQLRGELADHRSDIFALGAILHEMIAGSPAFRRDSRIATVNAVLESELPELSDDVAPAIRQIVRRCVEKEPDNRFQSARDLAFALNTLSGSMPAPAVGATPRRSRARSIDWRIAATAAALASAAIAGGVAWNFQRELRDGPRVVKRFVFQPPTGTPGVLALSPDGSRLVYSGGGFLQLRPMDQLEARSIPGSEGAFLPFFSPDGDWIAFTADRKLRKIRVDGGPAVTICDVSAILEGNWGADGQIVIAQREHGLMRVSAEGGVPQPLTAPNVDAGEIDHHAPHFLPGSKALLFTIHAGAEVFRVAVRSLETGVQRTLIDDGFDARYVPSGHLVYGRADQLLAAPFDVDRLEITGPSVVVVENVETVPGDGKAFFATASDGTLTYLPALVRSGRTLMWVDRTGNAEPLPTPPRAYDSPALSPDGKRLAVQVSEGRGDDIWLYEFATDSLSRVTLDGLDSKPVWSPDGKRLTYASRQKEQRHIMWQSLDASAPAESLVVGRNDIWPGVWTPDGERLIFIEDPPTSLSDIKIVSIGEKSKPEPFIAGPRPDRLPTLSPDGRWIAYTVFEGATPQIFVRPLTGGAPREITFDGGVAPRWSRDGREIFFRRRNEFMRVTIQTSPELRVGKPERLFQGVYVGGPDTPNYDVTADGQRFIVVKAAAEEQAPRPIHIVQDWVEELKRRVPVQR